MERVGKRACTDIDPNVLNLKQWIPQKDVIRLILMYLNKVDWKLVWAAHNKKYEKRLREHDWFWLQCALHGYLDLILWGINHKAYHFTNSGSTCLGHDLVKNAAKGGHLHILKWVWHQHIVPSFEITESIAMTAIEYGHVDCVEWFVNQTNLLEVKQWFFYCKAAQRSSIGVMELLKKHHVPMNHINCITAARYGQLDALKWLIANGCKWTEHILIEAIRYKHLHILEWAVENACPHDLDALQRIIWNNDDRVGFQPFKAWFEQRYMK